MVTSPCTKYHYHISFKDMVKVLGKVAQEGCGIATLEMLKTELHKTLNDML